MDPFTILQLIISLSEGILGALTHSRAPQEQIDRVQAALDQLRAVHGTAVTFGQLEGFRFNLTWEAPTTPPGT